MFALAIVAPGPNFILVTNTALNASRRAGLLTAFGVASGSGLFAFAGLVGLLPLVHTLPYFPQIMRFVGGGYMAWIGFDMLRTCRRQLKPRSAGDTVSEPSAWFSFRTGLLTNLANPKAWAFSLTLFTLVMGPAFPLWGKAFLNTAMFLISFGWCAVVVLLISSRTFQPHFLSCRPLIQSVLGLLLLVVGGKILWG